MVKHDYGFAPNPFGGFLTLATCKPLIRRNARLGDFLAGTGSAASVGNSKLVYAGEISAVVPLEEYGRTQKYKIKRPVSKPSFRRKGDNIYFMREGEWQQRENEYHGFDDFDAGIRGKNVLVCDRIWYFSDNAIELPTEFQSMIKKQQGHKMISDQSFLARFVRWLNKFPSGNHGSEREESPKAKC